MTECPACGASVPADGRYCPSCGREVAASTEPTHSPAGHHTPSGDESATDAAGPPRDSTRGTPEQQRESPNRRRQPRVPEKPQQPEEIGTSLRDPNPSNHKLLLGAVSGLSIIGLLDGVGRVAAPDEFTQQLMEASQETGTELDPGFAEQLVVGTGSVAILLSLLVVGLTVRNYRNRQLPKRYFWVMVVVGAAGFILASNLFLTFLVGFGIYGLVSVTD